MLEVSLEYTRHALQMMEERAIPVEWVESTVVQSNLITPDPNDSQVNRFFRTVPEYGDRVLRVAVNTHASPWRVVSVFFDRNMRGKL